MADSLIKVCIRIEWDLVLKHISEYRTSKMNSKEHSYVFFRILFPKPSRETSWSPTKGTLVFVDSNDARLQE